MVVNPTDCSELLTISAPSPNSCSCQALAATRKAGQPLPLTYRYTESPARAPGVAVSTPIAKRCEG